MYHSSGKPSGNHCYSIDFMRLYLCIAGCMDFCDSKQFEAGTEDKVDGSGRPFELTCLR